MFDADKNHHYHPTKMYIVQVTYHKCVKRHWWGGCKRREWKTFEHNVAVEGNTSDDDPNTIPKETIRLKETATWAVAKFLHGIACGVAGDQLGNVCSYDLGSMADQLLPSLEWPIPYQYTRVPTPTWMTKYHWRFRTFNGLDYSSWTGWASFRRIF
jgi:hypothetical protein